MVKIYKPKASQTLKGKSLTLKVDRLDFNGRGVARYQKKPVFIEQALPNEQVLVKVIEQTSKYIVGKLVQVEQPSEARIKPKCQYYNRCGGCDLQHIAESQHIEIKQNKVSELFSRQGIESLPWQQPIIDSTWHYRRKARIGVQYLKNGQAVIGFRARNTNTVEAISQCLVLAPELSQLLDKLSDIANQLAFGAIGHIELILTKHNDAPIVTLVIRQLKKLSDDAKSLWFDFIEQFDEKIQLFFDFGESKPLIALVPNETHQQQSLRYNIDKDIGIMFEPDNFIQVHHHVNQLMVEQALNWLNLTKDDSVLDLFCGLGNFSLPLAKRVQHVVGIEGVASMVKKAQKNAENNQLSNVEFYQANLNSQWSSNEDNHWLGKTYTKVLLDPARAGALEACQQIAQLSVNDVLYVSCDPATLARDSAKLIQQGFSISKIALMEMFGQTKHVETMVMFQRNQP